MPDVDLSISPVNVLLHFLPAAFAAGGAWIAVKLEIKYLRRDVNKMGHKTNVAVRKITEIAAEHKIYHGTSINLNGFDDNVEDKGGD